MSDAGAPHRRECSWSSPLLDVRVGGTRATANGMTGGETRGQLEAQTALLPTPQAHDARGPKTPEQVAHA